MSVPKITPNGEASEYSEGGTFRSLSPNNINVDLNISCKDASPSGNLPDAFRPKPKISRTPPNSNSATNASSTTNIVIQMDNDDITDESKYDFNENNNVYTHDSGTYQSHSSQHINSPSLSIEYPPGSSIPRIKNRKKFQFKKSHYQRFVGTSSAKKTKERRKSIIRDRSRSNSVISYQSSERMSTGCPNDLQILQNELVKHTQQNQLQLNNNKQILKTPQESLPPSPPSDDIISTLSQMMNKTPNKLPRHITTNSAHIIHSKQKNKKKVQKDQDNNDDDDEDESDSSFTVSSSPSLIGDSNTAQTTRKGISYTTKTKGYSKNLKSDYNHSQYRSRQHWTTLIHSQSQKRREIEEKTHSSIDIHQKIKLASTRSNYRPTKSPHNSFGAKSSPMAKGNNVIDESDKIRIALSAYDQRKGQNLEELFKPQKKCFYCVIL